MLKVSVILIYLSHLVFIAFARFSAIRVLPRSVQCPKSPAKSKEKHYFLFKRDNFIAFLNIHFAREG